MTSRAARLVLAIGMLVSGGSTTAQEPTLEYRVKAAYIYNFTQYAEWPPAALGNRPLTICVAGRDVFGHVLEDLVRGESIGGRPLTARTILEPEPGCHVLFVPAGAALSAYMRSARTAPVLTIGETEEFFGEGGIIRFVREGSKIRFEIDQQAAERVGLRLSSRLLRLARVPEGRN